LFRIIDVLLDNHKIFEQSHFFSLKPYWHKNEKIEINFNDIKRNEMKKELRDFHEIGTNRKIKKGKMNINDKSDYEYTRMYKNNS